MTETYTIWVCLSCMLHHVNGECGDCHTDEGHDREPWSNVDENDTFTRGMTEAYHECDGDEECDCEFLTFSRYCCGACGSLLAGERHAFTGWIN